MKHWITLLLLLCGMITESKEDSSLILSQINSAPEFTFKVSSYYMAVAIFGHHTKYPDTTFHKLINTKHGDTPIVVCTEKFKGNKMGKLDILIVEILDEWSLVSESAEHSLLLLLQFNRNIFTQPQNVDRFISSYKNSTHWQFETKVILLFSQYSPRNQSEHILQTFSNNSIFNVAILLPKVVALRKSCYFIYHNPFPEINSTFTVVRNPKNMSDGFPFKVVNLHGHGLNVVAVEKPPEVINRNGEALGTSAYLGDLMVKALNATKHTTLRSKGGFQTPAVDDIPINRFPFYSELTIPQLDYVMARDQGQLRIIVRNKNWFFSKYYVADYGQLVCLLFVVYNIMYVLLNFRQPNYRFIGCNLLPIWLRQPARVRTVTFKDRVFVASGLIFAFFTMSAFECHLTSDLVKHYPRERLQSIEDLERSNVRIYSDQFVSTLLLSDRYNVSKEILARLRVTEESPWTIKDGEKETWAYIIDTAYRKYLYKAVRNKNGKAYGSQRFYLMDHIIATTPLMFMFPKNSPYKEVFQRFHDRVVQAGLQRYWEVMIMRRDVWSTWSYFRSSFRESPGEVENGEVRPFYFAFMILGVGWSTSLLTLVGELWWSGRWSFRGVVILWSAMNLSLRRILQKRKRNGKKGQRKRVAAKPKSNKI